MSANKKLLNALREFAVLADGEGRIHFVNDAYCAAFGGGLEDWRDTLFEPGPGENGVHVERRDGPDGPGAVEWRASPLPRGASLYIGRDVTAQDAAQCALKAEAEDSAAQSDAKMRFLATMSHEMRTPLNGILGMAGLLLDSKLDPNQRTFAEAVRESGSALLALINDLLDYSKIEAGKLELEEAPFDPQVLLQNVAELLSPRAAQKGVEIATFVHPNVPARLIGDEARIRQVLLNLAGNGVKFTESGGVSLEARAEAAGGGRVRLIIDVRDTGIGIPPEEHQRIFDEFAQSDGGTARRFEGTGLGLSIAQRIISAMGGEISLQSRIGEGSVFSFAVSLKVQDGRARTPRTPIHGPVILATRSPVLRRVTSMQLKAAGATSVVNVETVDEALAAIGQHPDAPLLCDLYVAAEGGRRLAEASSRALVLLSPIARGRLEGFKRAGYHGYLIKPIRQSSLEERLHADAPARKEPSTRLDHQTDANASGAGAALRILLAEDNQINAVLATALIRRAGHHIDVAGNGIEALDAVKRAHYDVVLMDMHMPEMDGLEATRRIRSLSEEGEVVPIIALTANAMSADRQKCLNAGMDDFLAKPFDPDDLNALIEKWRNGRDGAEADAAAGKDDVTSLLARAAAAKNADAKRTRTLGEAS